MVEIVHASLAGMAVIALLRDQSLATMTIYHFLAFLSVASIFQSGVRRVAEGEDEEVDDDEEQSYEVGPVEDIDDAEAEVNHFWDEVEIEYFYCEYESDGYYLPTRCGMRASVDVLVVPLPASLERGIFYPIHILNHY